MWPVRGRGVSDRREPGGGCAQLSRAPGRQSLLGTGVARRASVVTGAIRRASPFAPVASFRPYARAAPDFPPASLSRPPVAASRPRRATHPYARVLSWRACLRPPVSALRAGHLAGHWRMCTPERLWQLGERCEVSMDLATSVAFCGAAVHSSSMRMHGGPAHCRRIARIVRTQLAHLGPKLGP